MGPCQASQSGRRRHRAPCEGCEGCWREAQVGRKPGEQCAFPWAAPSRFFPSAGRGRERCLDLAREVGAGRGDSAVACAGPVSPGWRCSRRALGEARGAHPAHCPTAGQWRPLPRCASLSWRPALEAKALSCRSCPLGCDESVRERGGLSQTFLSAQREAEQPGPEKPLDRSAQLRCRHGLSSAFLKCAF